MSFITYPLDDTDYLASDAGIFLATRTSGVSGLEGKNFDVSIADAHTLTFGKGLAFLLTDDFWGKVFCNTADFSIEVPAADGILERICRFVIQFDKTANKTAIVRKDGALSPSPVAPARSATNELYELVLGDYRITAGETSISLANWTDQRMNESLCGLMVDAITELPTAAYYAQLTALVDSIERELATVGGGSAYELKRLQYDDVTVPNTAWAQYVPAGDEETALAAAGYTVRATVPLTGALSSMTPQFTVSAATADCGASIANVAQACVGGIFLYADAVPSASIKLLSVLMWKAVA
jgi:hypothetical protein